MGALWCISRIVLAALFLMEYIKRRWLFLIFFFTVLTVAFFLLQPLLDRISGCEIYIETGE